MGKDVRHSGRALCVANIGVVRDHGRESGIQVQWRHGTAGGERRASGCEAARQLVQRQREGAEGAVWPANERQGGRDRVVPRG